MSCKPLSIHNHSEECPLGGYYCCHNGSNSSWLREALLLTEASDTEIRTHGIHQLLSPWLFWQHLLTLNLSNTAAGSEALSFNLWRSTYHSSVSFAHAGVHRQMYIKLRTSCNLHKLRFLQSGLPLEQPVSDHPTTPPSLDFSRSLYSYIIGSPPEITQES